MNQNSISISYLQIDYFDLKRIARNKERAFFSQSRCSHCVGSNLNDKCFKQQVKKCIYKKPSFNPCHSNNKRDERNDRKPNTCFRCESEDNSIIDSPKLDTSDKKVQ